MKLGNTGSKEFYRAYKKHSGASRSTELEDSTWELHTEQAELEETCRSYYAALYSAATPSAAERGAGAQARACFGERLTEGMKACLRAPIAMHEIEDALKSMKSGNSPGPNGILAEFYKIYWELIGDDYLNMISLAIQAGWLPTGVTKGLISLIHKGGERRKLTNWRPIALLNVAYKLFAKVLQLRLQLVFMEIIDFDQSAFLPMRFILDNIMQTHETLEWAEHTNHLPKAGLYKGLRYGEPYLPICNHERFWLPRGVCRDDTNAVQGRFCFRQGE
jgi:hypothetical protein